MNTPPPSPPGELVEDSEPEREQQRLAFKAKKREERKQKKLLQEQQQQQQQAGGGSASRSSGTGEGFSAAGSSRAGEGAGGAAGGVEESSSTKSGRRNEGARAGSSPFSSLSPAAIITTKPIDFSSYAYPKAKLKGSTSSNSFTSTTTTSAAPPPSTTSSYFPPRPSTSSSSTSLATARRSKSKSIDPSDAPPPECTFTDVEMRRLKKCVLCGEDWSQPGKKTRTKWAHLVNCTPAPSHSTLLDLIREYLDIVKAGGKEPRSLLEKKMFDSVKEEEDQAGQLWDTVPDDDEEEAEDVVLVVDESTLGKGKGRARGSRSVSTTSKASSRVASNPPPPPDEEPTASRSPSPFRSPSPTATASPSATSPTDPSIPANNHFSNFAYAGRSLSASTSNGGIKPRSTSTSSTAKIVVPDCTIRDIEMRKVKKCIFCREDWSTGKKAVKVKWAHLYSCSLLATPPLSLALLTHQITTHLRAPEPKTLLESLTMKKPKPKRGKGASTIPSLVLPAGHELSRESVMRNVESLMGEEEDETRRGDGDDEDEEIEERRPPSTQSFGTSGLAARFGARKGSGQEKRSLWAVGEEDGSSNEAGPSRLGGPSSEEDDESGSDSSMDDETDQEEEETSSKDQGRPRTSLWGLAVDTTASQLQRAGDENILSSPPQPQSKPSSLVPTQTIISISSSSSSAASSSLPTPIIQPSSSTTDHHPLDSLNGNFPQKQSPRSPFTARSGPRPSSTTADEEGDRRFDLEEEEERGEDSSISQEREEREETMSEGVGEGGEGRVVDAGEASGEEEDDEKMRSPHEEETTTNSSRSQQQRDTSIISIDDNDDDDLPILHQHKQRTPSRPKPNDRDDLFSPSSNLSRSFHSSTSISNNPSKLKTASYHTSNTSQSPLAAPPLPEQDFWSNSPPRHASSSSYFLPPPQSTSTPSRSSNIGSSSRQEIIDLSDDNDDDWGQEGVLRWDGGDGNELPPRDASSDDDVELLEHVTSSRPHPTSITATDPPLNAEEEEEGDEDEPYDQSDDRWGEEGVLVWDEDAGDVEVDEEGAVVGGLAEEELYEDLEEEEEEEERPTKTITPSKPKPNTTSNKPKKKNKKKAPPPMPDYEMMSIPQLQKIMKSYGTRVSSSRPQLLRVLREYWWLEHPLPSSSGSSSDDDDQDQDRAPSPSPARPRPKSKAPPRAQLADSDSEDDQPLRKISSEAKGKGKARVASSEEEDEDDEEFDSDAPLATPKKKKRSTSTKMEDGVSVPMEELPELFRSMIMRNEDLWLRVLRYEPVDFMELVTLVHEQKVKTKGWQTALKKWLDGQCITYWTEEQTGSRRRH